MSRKGRNAAAIAGLVATAILAAGLLVVVVNRNSPPVSGSSPSDAGALPAHSKVQWHATKVSAESSLSPFLAVSNGRLYMVTDVRQGSSRGPELWSSADAVHWQQAADPGFEPNFTARAAVGDGNGGLVVVGELTPSEAIVPQIWHATDGKTGTTSGQIVAAAVSAEQMVAFGDHDVVDMTKGAPEVRGLDAWHSRDGSTWTHSDLAGSDGYQAVSMTAWSGGFAALASQPGTDAGYGVWLSADGVVWHRAGSIATFGAVSIMALPQGLIVVGSRQNATLGMVPASWSSADGTTWTEAIAPVNDFGTMFDGAIVVGHSVVAIALSHVGWSQSGGGPSQSPGAPAWVPPSTWISNDGSPWQLLGAGPAFQSYLSSLTTFDGKVVVASITGVAEVTVSVGDLS